TFRNTKESQRPPDHALPPEATWRMIAGSVANQVRGHLHYYVKDRKPTGEPYHCQASVLMYRRGSIPNKPEVLTPLTKRTRSRSATPPLLSQLEASFLRHEQRCLQALETSYEVY